MQPPQVQKGVIFELSQANVEEWQLELFFVHFKGVELDERRGGHFHYHFQPATHMIAPSLVGRRKCYSSVLKMPIAVLSTTLQCSRCQIKVAFNRTSSDQS